VSSLGGGGPCQGPSWQAGAHSGRAWPTLWVFAVLVLCWRLPTQAQQGERHHVAALSSFAGSRPGLLQVQVQGFSRVVLLKPGLRVMWVV
jgi:hypothetical protein